MIFKNNLLFIRIALLSILSHGAHSQTEQHCETNDDCASNEICLDNKCLMGCQMQSCLSPYEKCFTKNHIPSCICDVGLIRKRNGQCEEPTCESDDECDVLERCVSAPGDDTKRCQCPTGYIENVYEVQRCQVDSSIKRCGPDAECNKPSTCINNMCLQLCDPKKCRSNEECWEYGECHCKSGYRLNIDNECEPYCITDENCGINEICEPSDGTFKCVCKNGYSREDTVPYRCLRPCQATSDCLSDEICSHNGCIKTISYE